MNATGHPPHPKHSHLREDAVEVLSAMAAGAAAGSIAGPAGAVAGGVIGGAIGAVAAATLNEDTDAKIQHEIELDEAAGIIAVGPDSKPPSSRRRPPVPRAKGKKG